MNEPRPRVSILTTVYNREKYLAECIKSVQKSRFQDYEHVIVDDRSSDDSVAIAKKYAAEDARIKLFINPTNLGDYPNRNQAAQHASGQFIKYLDADDLHGEWILTVMVAAMEQFPSAGLGIIDHGKNVPTFPTLLKGGEAQHAYYSGERQIFDRSPINAIIKKDVFDQIGGFTGKRMVGDFEAWHLLSEVTDVVVIPNGHAHYRVHDDQEMTAHGQDPIWGFRYLLISQEQLLRPTNPMDASVRSIHLKALNRRIGRTIIHAVKKHGWSKANQMRSESKKSWNDVVSAAFS